MKRFFIVLATLAAIVLTGAARILPASAATTPGYLWLQQFSATTAASSSLTLAGVFVNDCNGGLPTGSVLRISFDQAHILQVRITAKVGQSQDFNQTVKVPVISPPGNHVTAYRFAIIEPSVGPDMKTSPCLVTGVLGTPSE
jgi:hypothetical protein